MNGDPELHRSETQSNIALPPGETDMDGAVKEVSETMSVAEMEGESGSVKSQIATVEQRAVPMKERQAIAPCHVFDPALSHACAHCICVLKPIVDSCACAVVGGRFLLCRERMVAQRLVAGLPRMQCLNMCV